MNHNKKILIFDGNAIVHRAYHALPKLTTQSGKVVNAIYGFLLIFFRVLKDFKPDYVIATFDFPAPTFRDKIYKEYKAKRPKAPQELYDQIPEIKKILDFFGIRIFEKKGFEADDVIGTIVKLVERKQIFPKPEIIIVTGDLDVLQLIDDNTKAFVLRKGIKDAVLYDKQKVRERYGLTPEELVDYKALRGDPSDNIPGVPGIGEKTAISLIKQFKNLEGIFEFIEENSALRNNIPPKIRSTLTQFREQAFFSRKLSQINRNVPIDFKLSECKLSKELLLKGGKILENYEFFSLVEKLPKIIEALNESREESGKNKEEKNKETFSSKQQKLI